MANVGAAHGRIIALGVTASANQTRPQWLIKPAWRCKPTSSAGEEATNPRQTAPVEISTAA